MIIFLFLVSSIYAFVSITVHNKFMTFGLDLGNFDEIIWKLSKFKFPYSGVGCNWMMEDHFQFILLLFVPLYWIWSDARMLLISQSFIMVFAGLPLYVIGKKITHHSIFSFSVVFAYLFFIGTQFAILNEFHQITVAPFFIALVYIAILIKSIRLFIYSILALFIIKEDVSLLIASIGFGLLFLKGFKKIGMFTFIAGISFFFFLIYIFMPAISVKGIYDHLHFGPSGGTPIQIISNFIFHPIDMVGILITPSVKLQTLYKSLSSFIFLPIFAPLYILIPLLQDFLIRFIYAGPQYTKWDLVNHHAAVSSMLLAIASVTGGNAISKIISRFVKSRKTLSFIGIFLIGNILLADILFHGPLNSLLKKQFYFQEEWIKDNYDMISKVPKDASVAAQNNLLAHLTHRENIYRIPYGLNSEYMVIDLHDGPNKYAPLSFEEMKQFVQELLNTKRYSIVYKKNDAMILKRNYKVDITSSKYYGDTRHCYYSLEER